MWTLTNPHHFLDHVHLGCTQHECKPKTIIAQKKKKFESRISAGATEKLMGWETLQAQAVAWSYDTEGHAQKCVERYCELANKKVEQLYKSSSLCVVDHQFKKEGASINWRIIKHMLTNCLKNACTWRELVDPTFCGQSINLPDQSPNGHKLVTDVWQD